MKKFLLMSALLPTRRKTVFQTICDVTMAKGSKVSGRARIGAGRNSKPLEEKILEGV